MYHSDSTLLSISKSQTARMGISYAKLAHAPFLKRFNTTCNHHLKDICVIKKGTSITQNETESGGIPVVAGGKDVAYFHNTFNRSSSHITVSASGANSGFVNFWEVPIWASDCITIKSKDENEYCTRFLYYLLRIIQDDIYLLQKGSDQPHVYADDLKYLLIPSISYARQVDILDSISKFEKKEKTLRNMLLPDSGLIDEVFRKKFGFNYDAFEAQKAIKKYSTSTSRLSNNPDFRFSAKFHRPAGEYVMSELNRITDRKIKHFLAEPIVLGASVSPSDYDDNGEYRYISMATIKDWKFSPDIANLLSSIYSQAKLDKTVRKNDIIMARSGEGTIGKVALIEEDEIHGIFADFTIRIRLKNYSSQFAYLYFRTTYFQYLVEIFKKGLGNNTNIFPIILREFPIPNISLDEQQRIVDEITAEIEAQKQIHTQISELRKQIDRVITEAITA